MTQSMLSKFNNPKDAARLLKLLEYPDDEIVQALMQQYNLTEDAAHAAVTSIR